MNEPQLIMILNKIRSYLSIFSLLLLFACATPAASTAQTVYVTKTGKKYHKETCRYLNYSKIAMSPKEAKEKQFEACKVCKPSSITTNNETVPIDTIKVYKPIKKSISSRCTAITKSGTRCKRMTKNTIGKCWQHE